jgi:two-component system sensor histidine kinase MtrB
MPPGVRRPVELLTESTERLRRLVADLLELSRMDAGGALVHREAVALHETIRGVVRLCGWESGVALALEPICVDTDCRRLERILVNLVSNAVQHGRRGIGVRAAVEGDHAVVEVADDGPGIPEEDLPRIFDRFYKADPARASGGSGLGLAIALENARLLGTEIEVWSRPGEGARFAFRLPLWRREPEPGDRREEREVRVASGTRVRSIPRST